MKYNEARYRVATRVCDTIQANTDGNVVAEPEYRTDNFDIRQIPYKNVFKEIVFNISKRDWLC